ncbi:Sterol desaturase/sphingolipid hydroxylase, fatty acid hydroxylase superfamily [Variovorax sp. YR750]|uniref:sterol desaturase family protein n=1 Tax=Variovorax sp. YR750 TaxID=1884384 RepID=UPI0008CCB156|nr:sterol desaturase family protein [Variovorax sp. YR750]SEK63570.1 Sterol desaturase/sphingolipid hydroxylase, fatty acid hydroxylase superfamily [Variovorax sp. YR750]
MHRLVVLVVPVFALLMACEFAWGWLKRRNTYRFADTIGSLSQGLLSQALAVCTQLFQIGLYAMVYPLVAIWTRPAFWDGAMGWIAAVLLFDFFDYWLHRAGHESAVFWAAHSVHHQSQHFNFSTALRQESTVAFLGWVFYLPMAVVGVPPEQFGLAGLIVLVYQFWIHTEHIGKLGWFDRVFSSPSNHRVHHAVNDGYVDRNYGGMLVVWDRMFGTFAEETERCVYGTRKALSSFDPMRAILGPYAPLLRDAWHTKRWRDKIAVWFKPPGWRPADVAARFPEPAFSLEESMHIHDPALTRAQVTSAALHFACWVGVTLAFLWRSDDLAFQTGLTLLAMAVGGFWSIGAVLDSRLRLRWAWCAQAALLAISAVLLFI